MNKTVLWGLIILVGVVLGWFYFNGDLNFPSTSIKTSPNLTETQAPPTDGSAPVITDESQTGGDLKGGGSEQLTVRLTDAGFEPKEITIQKGATVTFVNNSASAMWVASGVHPTHQLLPGFDQKTSVTKGGTYVYTFAKVGTWKFHNHVSAEITGTVIVK